MRRLGLAQRIVLVVGFGAVLMAAGRLIEAAAAGGQAQVGWFGYAPLVPAQDLGTGLSDWEQFLLWLGLIVVWTAFSLFVLRPPSSSQPN